MANNVEIKLNTKLKKQIENMGKEIAKNVAIYIRDDLTNTYELAIDKFYDEYKPLQYKRTGEFKKSYVKYNSNQYSGLSYLAGVKISTERMKLDNYSSTNEEVVGYAIDGWHGHPSKHILYKPSAYEIVMKRRRFVFDNIQELTSDIVNTVCKKYGF